MRKTFDPDEFERRFPRREGAPCTNAMLIPRFPRQVFSWRIRLCMADNVICSHYDRPDAVKLCPVLNGYTPGEYKLPGSDMASRTTYGWITSDQYALCPVSHARSVKG